jgi:hypothetical protein
MPHYRIGLVGLVALALVSALSLSACILVPVGDGRDRGGRDWHGDDRERHEEYRR